MTCLVFPRHSISKKIWQYHFLKHMFFNFWWNLWHFIIVHFQCYFLFRLFLYRSIDPLHAKRGESGILSSSGSQTTERSSLDALTAGCLQFIHIHIVVHSNINNRPIKAALLLRGVLDEPEGQQSGGRQFLYLSKMPKQTHKTVFCSQDY